MRTMNTLFYFVDGALAPNTPHSHNIKAREQVDSFAPQDDFNREFEHNIQLLWRELGADVEYYYRAHEEGWFYPDRD